MKRIVALAFALLLLTTTLWTQPAVRAVAGHGDGEIFGREFAGHGDGEIFGREFAGHGDGEIFAGFGA